MSYGNEPLGNQAIHQNEAIASLYGASKEQIARLVLWLLIEEGIKSKLTAFRAKNLTSKPRESQGELLL